VAFILPKEIYEKDSFIYTCHPVAHDEHFSTQQNLDSIDNIERRITNNGNFAIISPWSSLCRVTEDANPEERKTGIDYNLHTLRVFKLISDKLGKPLELWVYGHKISKGMREEIELAKELGIPVRIKDKRLKIHNK
jgi:hypothetical protein